MLAEPGTAEYAACCGAPAGIDDSIWFRDRLDEAGLAEEVAVTTITITKGDILPPVESCRECIVVLGGTFNGVGDDRPWQRELQTWLLDYRELCQPLLGICGGHQVMAYVLHGEGAVETRRQGPIAGSAAVTLTTTGEAHPLFTGLGSSPVFHFGNGDHVVVVPECATILASIPYVIYFLIPFF